MKIKFVFLLLPQIHLLDLAGPDQAIHEAIDYGADFSIDYCCDEAKITSTAGLPLGTVKHYSKVKLKAGDFLIIPGSNFSYLTSTALRKRKEHFRWNKSGCMMNYSIRTAPSSDIEEIINLCSEHALSGQAIFDRSGKEEKLSRLLFCENPGLHCLMVEQESKIVGYATFSFEYSTWNADYYTHMDCLFIREAFRGYGIGEALVNTIIEQSKLKRSHHLEWQTPIFNERAIKFYNRMGATSKEKLRFTFTF